MQGAYPAGGRRAPTVPPAARAWARGQGALSAHPASPGATGRLGVWRSGDGLVWRLAEGRAVRMWNPAG